MIIIYEHDEALWPKLEKCNKISEWMIDEKCSIRSVEKELCIPKSTVHDYIHSYIKWYDDESYCQLIRILKYNKKYKVGRPSKWRR